MIATTLAERYLIEAVLGRGGMGTVYRARDLLLERPVAIKVVSDAGLGSEGRSRLLQEAQATARLNHPNIVAVYDVGSTRLPGQTETTSYIVMEMVEGQTLREAESLSLERIIDLGKDICRALDAAHQQGIIHRDLKPENVAVTVSGSVKLMDFGLARIRGKSRLTEQGTFMGTMSYLAPEIILGQEASPASDLYALGVMLYEMSAGRPPFEGGDLTALLSQHLHAPVVPPGAYNGHIPPLLDDLIVRLLSKRPEDRPATAGDVFLVLERISLIAGDSFPAAALPEISRLVRGRMIGREEEFGQAVRLWHEATAGRGQVLLVSGEPGIGKTRLVRELCAYAEISGGKTVTGYCYAQERSPYGPIARMVEGSLRDGSGPELPQVVLADLLTLAPELRLYYPDLPANERLDPEGEQQRLFDSIITWFVALTREGQVLMVVDDVHWADSGSLALLSYLSRLLDRRRALIVATYREVELDQALPFQEFLNALNRDRLATRIKLSRLNETQTGDLLATLLAEEITPEFLESVYRETEGNPFFIEEVCKALVDGGELYFADGRWRRSEVKALVIPQGIKVTIQSRLSRLSPVEQRVLQIGALLGRDFEYDMLAAVVELDEDEMIEALERAEKAQLVEEVRRPGRVAGMVFTFTHALIHSTLLSSLSTLRRQRMQRQVALALEERFPDRRRELASMLGRYFAEAGDGVKAVHYLSQAGDDARAVFAYDEAVEAYEQALLFLREESDHRQAGRTLMKVGLTYHNLFEFDRSRQAYDEAFVEMQRAGDGDREGGRSLPEAPHALRAATQIGPASLDPAVAHDNWSFFWIELLYRGLVELTAGDEIVPDVARSWDVLENGTRYVFHLRDDVLWSDGNKVTAGDFEYGIKRALAPTDRGSIAENLYDIEGAAAFHGGRETDPEAVGVRALDDLTLEIRLEGPSSYFLQVMALATTFAAPKAVLEEEGGIWRPPDRLITNGPFRVHTWLPDERYVLERAPGYRGRFEGNLERFELTVASGDEWLAMYDNDTADLLFPFQESVEKGFRAIQLHPDDYMTGPAANSQMLTFDVTRPPFDDVRVRQAMALAIDRQNIVNQTIRGVNFPATGGLVPAGIPGHVPGIGMGPDPLLARQKLAEAGYPGGAGFPEIEFLLMENDDSAGTFSSFCEHWAEFLGINVRLHGTDFNTMIDRQANDPPPLWLISWGADYPDPDTFLRAASWLKNGGWRHREYETLVNDARRVLDREQRLAMYRQAELILAEEVPVIPIAYGRYHVLVKPWVSSWAASGTKNGALKDVVIRPH